MALPKAANTSPSRAKVAAIALVAVVLVTAAAFAGYKRASASAAEGTIPTATVTRGDVQSSVPADGRVAVADWELGFGASGRVASVTVSEGETVTAGQVLATLDNVKAAAQVTQAQAGLASASAKLAALREQPAPEEVDVKQALVDAASSTRDRAQEAYDLLKAASLESTVSASELQAKAAAVASAESQLDIAETNLAAAKVPASSSEIDAAEAAVTDAVAGLRAAQSALADYAITAPAAGVVVSLGITEGQVLSASSGQAPAIVIADIADLHVEGQIDEADVAAVDVGMPVDVIVDALGGQSVEGHVERIAEVAQVDQNGLATFAINVALDESADGLASGMAVRMQVITDRAADVLTIPTVAVRRSAGKAVVTVVEGDGSTSSVTVELGKTDGMTVEVISGLREGQKVALSSVTEVKK